jgi:hypothetical protein
MNRKIKKLSLSRETVRHLDSEVLQRAVGGATTVCPNTVSCDSCTCTQLGASCLGNSLCPACVTAANTGCHDSDTCP